MAGLRETENEAEAEGVRRARSEIAGADLVLWLVAPDAGCRPEAQETAASQWTVATKADLGLAPAAADLEVSVRTGRGLDELLERLRSFVADQVGTGEPALVSRERDLAALQAAAAALRTALERLDESEIAAEQLRIASQAMERLLGRMDAESVLDHLFARFCIGK
jgi:tRNA modification GTPase